MKKILVSLVFLIGFFVFGLLSTVKVVEAADCKSSCVDGWHLVCGKKCNDAGGTEISNGCLCEKDPETEGESCTTDADCGAGYYCDNIRANGKGNCKKVGGGGGGSKKCNQLCVKDSSCISGLSCKTMSGVIKRCRAPACQDDTTCACANASPTPESPTATPGGPTPTVGAPTPTVNPDCKCNALNTCNNKCTFEKYDDVTYNANIKCGLSKNMFQSNPTDADKNAWCRAALRTKGDADGDGTVTFKDYFYYVTAKLGFKIPATVNPDFNGDNVVDTKDREIIIKSLLGN